MKDLYFTVHSKEEKPIISTQDINLALSLRCKYRKDCKKDIETSYIPNIFPEGFEIFKNKKEIGDFQVGYFSDLEHASSILEGEFNAKKVNGFHHDKFYKEFSNT